MMARLVLLPLVVGCGRLSFDHGAAADAAVPDASPDAASPDLAAGCVVALTLEEPTWTGAAGEVLNGCNPTLNGTAVQGAQRIDDPVRGRVGDLPLPSGCIHLPDAPTLHATTGLTLSAWIYPRSLDGKNPYGVIAKRTDFTMDDAEYTMFVWTDNTVWVDIDSLNDRNHGTRQLANGQWQMITAVYDGTLPTAQRVTIYVNGAHDATLPETSASLTPYPSSLSIGCLPEQPATKPQIALGGEIDLPAIWTRALSAQEVGALYETTRR